MDARQLGRYTEDKAETINRLDMRERTLLPKGRTNLMTTIVGPRRSGKTYLLYAIAKKNTSRCLYLNFDDLELDGATYREIANYPKFFEEAYGRAPEVVLLDEVQRISGWERAVSGLFEAKKYQIFLTGSSSKLLATEVATSLRGRSLKHVLMPLSFGEYLSFAGWQAKSVYSTSDENTIKNHLANYLKYGGFPDVALDAGISQKFFEEYLDMVIYKDIVERYGVKNLFVLKYLLKSIIASYSGEFSAHKVYNSLRSQGIKISKKTIYNYLAYFEDAMFCFGLRKFSTSARKSELSATKMYLVDTGVASHALGYEAGKAMENGVYLEFMRRRANNPPLDISYWRSGGGAECDFIADDGKKRSAIQVTYELKDENRKREIGGLMKASAALGCSDRTIITWDAEEKIKADGKTISVVPLWKWFLSGGNNIDKVSP